GTTLVDFEDHLTVSIGVHDMPADRTGRTVRGVVWQLLLSPDGPLGVIGRRGARVGRVIEDEGAQAAAGRQAAARRGAAGPGDFLGHGVRVLVVLEVIVGVGTDAVVGGGQRGVARTLKGLGQPVVGGRLEGVLQAVHETGGPVRHPVAVAAGVDRVAAAVL